MRPFGVMPCSYHAKLVIIVTRAEPFKSVIVCSASFASMEELPCLSIKLLISTPPAAVTFDNLATKGLSHFKLTLDARLFL